MQNYKCPHTKMVRHQVGDFKTVNGRDIFVVEKEFDEEVPCGCESYWIYNATPFNKNSGIDPRTIEVECFDCEKRSYIMPAIIGRQPKEFKQEVSK
jgi:hypothetical protein